jgi:tRNA dimethylallyltransferase
MVNDRLLPPLVALVGPTAVGKTKLSLELARATGAEIVSADSRLVYRGMDIGTAKPSMAEREEIPHHLIDIADPDRTITVAEYQQRAYAAIEGVSQRGRVPLLVGGSGQYVCAILEGWRIPRTEPDPVLRAELEDFARTRGPRALHERLEKMDPTAAERIDFRNVRRVVRALEVTLKTGRPISELQGKSPPPYRILRLGLTLPRDELYARIDARIDEMLSAGLVDEVRALAAAGYHWRLPSMEGLGYRQIGLYLRGKATLQESVQLIRRETRRFVRQQGTWFRLKDPLIHWFDLQQTDTPQIISYVSQWLGDDLMEADQQPP